MSLCVTLRDNIPTQRLTAYIMSTFHILQYDNEHILHTDYWFGHKSFVRRNKLGCMYTK